MHNVRFGIIGMGNIGQFHAGYLLDRKVAGAELVAVCSASQEKRRQYEEKGVKSFSGSEALLKSGEVDAVIIATPHFQHTALGMEAFANGVHVLMEKPISAHKADAERLIAAHRRNP